MEKLKTTLKLKFNNIDLEDESYIDNNTKCTFICNSHGSFKSIPKYIVQTQYGCEKCSYEIRSENYKGIIFTSAEQITKRIQSLHSINYTFSKLDSRKGTVNCKIHGNQNPRFISSIEKTPCLLCKKDQSILIQVEKKQNKRVGKKTRDERNKERAIPFNSFYEILSLEFKEKYLYDISTFINMNTKMAIICSFHGGFWQTPAEHKKASIGCPKCNCLNKSKQETAWLSTFDVSFQYQKKLKISDTKYFIVDAFDPLTNTVYEYFGDFWHGNLNKYSPDNINPICKKTFKQLNEETLFKLDSLKSKDFNIIYIWESDFKNKKSYSVW